MYQHKRGKIKESAIKALVTDPLFSNKIEKPKKGKGLTQERTIKNLKVGRFKYFQ